MTEDTDGRMIREKIILDQNASSKSQRPFARNLRHIRGLFDQHLFFCSGTLYFRYFRVYLSTYHLVNANTFEYLKPIYKSMANTHVKHFSCQKYLKHIVTLQMYSHTKCQFSFFYHPHTNKTLLNKKINHTFFPKQTVHTFLKGPNTPDSSYTNT